METLFAVTIYRQS